MPLRPCPLPYVQANIQFRIHLHTQAFFTRALINHNIVIIPQSSSHNKNRHPTRIHPLRTNPLDHPPTSYKQQQPYLANHFAPAINLHNFPGLRCIILLVAFFRLDRFFIFPYAPGAPPSLRATDELGQVVPEFRFRGFIPAVDGHKPVAAL